MKKILSALLLILVLMLSVMPAYAAENTDAAPDTGVTINVYNWGQYIADGSEGSMDIIAEFTRRTGINVNYMTYDTNEALYTKLKNGGSNYDIIILFRTNKLYILHFLWNSVDYNRTCLAHVEQKHKEENYTFAFSLEFGFTCVCLESQPVKHLLFLKILHLGNA